MENRLDLDSFHDEWLVSPYRNERPRFEKDERIKQLAYFRWRDAGGPPGDGVNFWLEAEAEYEAAERLIYGS